MPQRIDGGQSAVNPPPNMTSNGSNFNLSGLSATAGPARPESVPNKGIHKSHHVLSFSFVCAYVVL
jgi:hypothetical protein